MTTARRLSPEELAELRGHCDNLAAETETRLFSHIEALEAELAAEHDAASVLRKALYERQDEGGRLRAELAQALDCADTLRRYAADPDEVLRLRAEVERLRGALDKVRALLERQGMCGEGACTELATCELWPILDALGERSSASPDKESGRE